jgi:hypothetical protein
MGMARRVRQHVLATDDWQQLQPLFNTPGPRIYIISAESVPRP